MEKKAKSNAIPDRKIQKIINHVVYIDPYARNVIGKRFCKPMDGSPFADVHNRVIYIPNWIKQSFHDLEFEWIVLHELGHVVHKHTGINPRVEELEASRWACFKQGTKVPGKRALFKLSRNYLDAYSSERIENAPPPLTFRELIEKLQELKLS